jgi:hypothetical protein
VHPLWSLVVTAIVPWSTVFAVFVVLGFAFALLKVNRRTREIVDPLREEIMQRPILYRRPHTMKYLINGQWSIKRLAGMELIVTEGGVGMTSRVLGISDVLGSQWWARSLAFEVDVERIARVPPLSEGSDWVVIRSDDDGNAFEVAILPEGHREEILTALRKAGAR